MISQFDFPNSQIRGIQNPFIGIFKDIPQNVIILDRLNVCALELLDFFVQKTTLS